MDERGVHADKPLWVGWLQREWLWQPDPVGLVFPSLPQLEATLHSQLRNTSP